MVVTSDRNRLLWGNESSRARRMLDLPLDVKHMKANTDASSPTWVWSRVAHLRQVVRGRERLPMTCIFGVQLGWCVRNHEASVLALV